MDFRAPKSVNLKDISAEAPDTQEKKGARDEWEEYAEELKRQLELMFFAGTHSLLVVLQGMDTSGKDGTIRCLFDITNVQSAHVASFKVPTPEELAHDFLWRCHMQTPGKGEFCVFNRSHYEDVLVVRVHNFVPETVWSKRYETINAFEKGLADANTIVLKFFLHITPEEQESRLHEREQEVEKAWKLSVGDWKERAFWNDYQAAYESVLEKCNPDCAPWFIVPANDKWYRNLVVTKVIAETLREYEKGWLDRLAQIGEKAKAELAAYRQETASSG